MKTRKLAGGALLTSFCDDAVISKSLYKLPYDRFFRVAISLINAGVRHTPDGHTQAASIQYLANNNKTMRKR